MKVLLTPKNLGKWNKHQNMLICSFDVRGFILSEFVPQGQTINKALYQEVLKRFHNRGRGPICSSLSVYNHIYAHIALSVHYFFLLKMTWLLFLFPYSSNFPKWKETWKESFSRCCWDDEGGGGKQRYVRHHRRQLFKTYVFWKME